MLPSHVYVQWLTNKPGTRTALMCDCIINQRLWLLMGVFAAANRAAASSTAAVEPHRGAAAAAEPHVPTHKELLAASLFGDSAARPARQRRQPAHHAVPAAQAAPVNLAAVITPQPGAAKQPAAPDLLLALASPGRPSPSTPVTSSGTPASCAQGTQSLSRCPAQCVDYYTLLCLIQYWIVLIIPDRSL